MKMLQLGTWLFLSILILTGCRDNAMTNNSDIKFLVLDSLQPCVTKVFVDNIEKYESNKWVDNTYHLTVVENSRCLSKSEKLIFSFTELASGKPIKSKMLYCEFIEMKTQKGVQSTIGAGSLFETHTEAEKHLSELRQFMVESEELDKSSKSLFDKNKFSGE